MFPAGRAEALRMRTCALRGVPEKFGYGAGQFQEVAQAKLGPE